MAKGAAANPLEEPTVADLLKTHAGPNPDRELAARYAPVLLFDAQEPFLPLVVGYTVFRQGAHSPSAHRWVHLVGMGRPRADTVIEYAVWWDWDITHLYELEHIWAYLDANGEVIHCEGSRHGRYLKMLVDGGPPLINGRLTLYSESGKHSLSPARRRLERVAPFTRKMCTRHAGLEGVFISWLFRAYMRLKTPQNDRLVHTYLEHYAFEPSLDFSQVHPIPAGLLVPWPALYEWIPRRLSWWINQLDHSIPPHQRRYLRIAQRGASAHAPENTLAAIRKAAELGADMVKLDVQHSADGVPVIIHGEDLSRTTNGSGPVWRHKLSRLKKLDAGNGEEIPTLEEAIACCRRHHLGLYLELQSGVAIQPVVEAIKRHRLHDRVGVCAFRPDWLARLKALAPRIQTAILIDSPKTDAVALARSAGAEYVHAAWESPSPDSPTQLAADWLHNVRAAGLGILCSHDKGLCSLTALCQHGIDGICSNRPELLRPRVG